MKKKIAAVAVAGLFAAPAVALAQSSVTISGQFKMGLENLKLNDFNRTGANTNKSQYGVVDDSSRIVFNVREDLGGGLAAIVQLDIRSAPDVGSLAGSGNSHVGLHSKSWGRIFLGRQDLHYFNTSANINNKNSLRADSVSLLAYAGGGAVAIANATRTQNVVHYTTPNWGGFTGIIAYSSNPSAQDGDMAAGAAGSLTDDRTGRAWHLNPNYAAANWQVGYSYWNSKADGGGAMANQEAHRLYGHYVFGFGLKVGLAWDQSKIKADVDGGASGTVSKRGAWSIPFQYSFMGKHQITGHYTKAKSDTKLDDIGISDTGANMWALGYSYDLSKRTSLGVTYARINNKSGAAYNLFTSTSLGLGSGGVLAGEDPRMWGTTIRHAF